MSKAAMRERVFTIGSWTVYHENETRLAGSLRIR
jgi:hypothetical protein